MCYCLDCGWISYCSDTVPKGSFSVSDTVMVNDALRYYALALPGMSIRLVTVKAFYSLQDTKTPVINAAITVALNIVLNIVLMRLMGHVGLALATAIASDALAILLLVSLYKKVKRFDVKHLLVTFLKTLIASLCMGIIIYSVYHFVLSQICVSFFKRFCVFVPLH